MEESDVRVVVVGYGYAGRRLHAPLVVATRGLQLYGVVARSTEAQQDVHRWVAVALVMLEDS